MVTERGGERHIPFPVWADGRRGAALRSTAPQTGGHTAEVMAEIGFTATDIRALAAAGTFGPAMIEAAL